MQCTSYIPVYYHARDLNVGASGFSWHPFDSDANRREERGYNTAVPPYNMDQYLGYDKEVLKQIIQNHEATFRYQVQELHRLYRRQRELMDEMRVREIFANHLLSQTSESVHSLAHAQPQFSQTPSHRRSWLLGDLSRNIQCPSNFAAENYQENTTVQPDSFIRKNSFNDVKFLSFSSKGNENRIVNLELPAGMYLDDQGKQFNEGNLSETPRKLPNFQPASDSDVGSVKTGDSSCFNLNCWKANCFIDLNEPVQLESSSLSSASGPFETCQLEIMHNNPCVPVEAMPKSDGINLPVAIDLNSLPVSCSSETEITLENRHSLKKETTVVLDCSSAYDHAMKNEIFVEDHPVVHKMNGKFLKTEIEIDLNTDIVDEHSPPLSSSVLQIKLAEDTELEGPVSPENEECSPPRGKSEEIQVETPLLSEQGEGEPSVEPDNTAAQTLLLISSSEVLEYNFKNSLCWFAEIVSSTGDDLENEIMKPENDEADNDKGEVDALKLSHVTKEKETGSVSSRSGKGRTRGTKQRKDFQTEVLPSLISLSEDLHAIEGFVATGPLKRKAGSKACPKPRKYSKLSSSDVVKKSMSSILKQPTTRSKQGVLQSWGKIMKRGGGRRRRASEFLLIS